ncbi:hypothetical protein DYB28_001295, partial [Aphanomyces astaci]
MPPLVRPTTQLDVVFSPNNGADVSPVYTLTVYVDLSFNGVDFTADNVIVTVVTTSFSIAPTFVWNVGIFKDIWITGPNGHLDEAGSALECQVGSSTSPVAATVINSTTATCRVLSTWLQSDLETTLTFGYAGSRLPLGTIPFTFVAPMTITSMAPRFGPGGAAVTIILAKPLSLRMQKAVGCTFGNLYARGQVENGSVVTCVVPMTDSPTTSVPVSLVVDNQLASWTPVYFTYIVPPTMLDIIVVQRNRTIVVVRTTGPLLPNLSCLFGHDLITPATTRMDSLEVECMAPPPSSSVSGSMQVQLLYKMMPYAVNTLTYQPLPPAQVTAATPNVGFIQANTTIVLQGSGLSVPLVCQFTCYPADSPFSTSTALLLSSSMAQCVAPSLPSPALTGCSVLQVVVLESHTVLWSYEFRYIDQSMLQIPPVVGRPTLQLNAPFVVDAKWDLVVPPASNLIACSFDDFSDLGSSVVVTPAISATRLSCDVPRGAIGVGVVRVLWQEYAIFTTDIEVIPPARVDSYSPSIGATTGGTRLRIRGQRFHPALPVQCRFGGSLAVNAQYMNESLVECVTPPRAQLNQTNMDVLVGRQVVSLQPGFTYLDPPTLVKAIGGSSIVSVQVSLNWRAQEPFGVYCNIANITTFGEWTKNSTSVRCDGGGPSVALSWNTQEWSERLPIHVASSVTSLWPMKVFARQAPQLIKVTGQGLFSASHCVVGTKRRVVVNATDDIVFCLVHSDDLGENAVSVSVSVNNGHIVLPSNLTVAVFPAPTLEAIEPAFGSVLGGTLLHMWGSNLPVEDGSAWCQFRPTVASRAIIRNTSLATCTTPPFTSIDGDIDRVLVTLWVSSSDVSTNAVAYGIALGRTGGGTQVILQGSGFADSAALRCEFGDVDVPATWLSPSNVSCQTPPSQHGNATLVPFSLSGCGNGTSTFFYYYIDPPTIDYAERHDDVDETWVYVSSATAGWPRNVSSVTCHADNRLVQGRWFVGMNRVTCPVSVHRVGLSLNGVDVSNVVLVRDSLLALVDIVPRMGSVAGGLVSLISTAFNMSRSYGCVVDRQVRVDLVVINATHGQCMLPSFEGSDTTTHSISYFENQADDGDTAPQSNPLVYWVVQPPQVNSIDPVLAFQSTLTTVALLGRNFIDSPMYQCRIGNTSLPANWISPTQVNCVIASKLHANEYSVGLLFAADASNYLVPQPLKLTILPDPEIAFITPTHGNELTTITIVGSSFPQLVMCAMDQAFVQPTFVNQTMVVCAVPPLLSIPSILKISLAVNGHTSLASVLFSAEAPPAILQVFPTTIASTWTSPFQLMGLFTNTTLQVQCRFESTSWPLEITTMGTIGNRSTLAFCPPPKVSPSLRIALSVSTNGQAFSNRIGVSIVSPATLASVQPSTVIFGPNSTSAFVSVLGYNMPTECACEFRLAGQAVAVSSSATWVSSFKVNCIVPPSLGVNTYAITLVYQGMPLAQNSLRVELAPVPTVIQVYPTATATLQNSSMTIVGSAFSANTRFMCSFGDKFFQAVRTNSTMLSCLIPSTALPNVVAFTLTGNDVVVLVNQSFTYFATPQVVEIVPSILHPTTTCDTVDIRGFDLVPIRTCHWMAQPTVPTVIVTRALYVNSTLVQCNLDTVLATGTYNVYVLWNGHDLSRVGTVQVVPGLHLTSMVPSFGMTWQSEVVLFGTTFSPRETVWCSYDLIHVEAIVVNSTALRCNLQLSSAQIKTHHVVYVAVTTNQVDYSNALPFEFAPEFYVRAAMPATGTVAGQSEVHIVGYFPVQSGTFECRFGSAFVPATSLNSSHLVCFSPPSPTASSVPLAVAWNDLVVDNTLSFEYVDAFKIVRVRPIFVPVDSAVNLEVTTNGGLSHEGVCGDFALAYIVNSTSIVCPFSSNRLGIHTIYMQNNRQRTVLGQVQVTVLSALDIDNVTPTQISEAGGAMVTVRVATDDIMSLQCRFGANSSTIQATLVNASSGLECIVPSSLVTTDLTVDVWFQTSKVAASVGVVLDSATDVLLSGSYFVQEPRVQLFGVGLHTHLVCDFGGSVVGVENVSPYVIQCTLPRPTTPTTTLVVRAGQSLIVLRSYELPRAVPPVVQAVLPNFTSSFMLVNADSTTVEIVGTHFQPLASAYCVVNSTPTEWDIALSTNEGRQFVSFPTFVLAMIPAEAEIVDVWPLIGYENKSTRITVEGYSLDTLETLTAASSSTVQCLFGTVASAAVVASPTELHCMAPRQAPGLVTLSIVPATMFRQLKSFTFQYIVRPVLVSVQPTVGSGGTLVTVTMSVIPFTPTLSCQFDMDMVPAMYVNSTTILCQAPRYHSAGRVALRVFLDSENEVMPSTSASATFEFRPTPVVSSVWPDYMLDKADTILTVHGFNLDV